jgi:outer membrane protein assembly factor BamB
MYQTKITCINYGPYDNGHILVGMEDGTLIAFDALTMQKIFKMQVFDNQPIHSICFDPTQLIFITCSTNEEFVAITIIENKVKYLYADLGRRKYCTIQL